MAKINNIETEFFNVLNDLKDYLKDLTLVGGWLPYIYSRFLWRSPTTQSITTADIDFGIRKQDIISNHSSTIFDMLSKMDYTERYIELGKLSPVVLCKAGKIPIHFITDLDISDTIIKKIIGVRINIDKIDKFNFLLEHRIPITVNYTKAIYNIYCPKPSAFLYHKGGTFIDRDEQGKQAKDLHYMYFILRFAPDVNTLFEEITSYKKKGYFSNIADNINDFFRSKTSEGCIMVEKEHGLDEYIEDLRQDIFEKFRELREILKSN